MPAGWFFDDVSGLLRVLIFGTIGYFWRIVVLRLTGERTLAALSGTGEQRMTDDDVSSAVELRMADRRSSLALTNRPRFGACSTCRPRSIS